jgi:hypothetical protein
MPEKSKSRKQADREAVVEELEAVAEALEEVSGDLAEDTKG